MTDPPATVRTVCPHCRALLAVATEFADRSVACGRCRQVFQAQPAMPPFSLGGDGVGAMAPTPSDPDSSEKVSRSDPSTPSPPPRGGRGARACRLDDDEDLDDRPRRRRGTDGSATASLVLGIVSLVFFCVFPVSLTTGAIGAWLGVAGLKSRSRPLAVTGLTLSAVGIVFGLGFTVLFLAGVVKAVNDQPRLGPARNNPTFHGR